MTDSNKALLGDVPEAWMALVRAQLDLSRGLFESLTGAKVPRPTWRVTGAITTSMDRSCSMS